MFIAVNKKSRLIGSFVLANMCKVNSDATTMSIDVVLVLLFFNLNAFITLFHISSRCFYSQLWACTCLWKDKCSLIEHQKQCTNQVKKFASFWCIFRWHWAYFYLTLHKKWSFPFRITSVNVTKSAVS